MKSLNPSSCFNLWPIEMPEGPAPMMIALIGPMVMQQSCLLLLRRTNVLVKAGVQLLLFLEFPLQL